jgi:hypothetical protein
MLGACFVEEIFESESAFGLMNICDKCSDIDDFAPARQILMLPATWAGSSIRVEKFLLLSTCEDQQSQIASGFLNARYLVLLPSALKWELLREETSPAVGKGS